MSPPQDSLGDVSNLSDSSDGEMFLIPSRTLSGTQLFRRRKSSEIESIGMKRQFSLRTPHNQDMNKHTTFNNKTEISSIIQSPTIKENQKEKKEKQTLNKYESSTLRGYHSDSAIDHARKKSRENIIN